MGKKVFYIKTFGCKTNQIESEYISEQLERKGYHRAENENVEKVDLYVINSCSVTNEADCKVLRYISHIRRKHSRSKIVLTGCFAQTHFESLRKNSEIDFLLGNNEKLKLSEIIENNKIIRENSNIFRVKDFESFKVSNLSRSRANLKIQDGCNNRCSYCIIPYARGNSRSNSIKNIINQINELESNGFQEIILTGIHIGQWGLDFEYPLRIIDLLREIENTGIKRVRIGSLTPDEIDKELLGFLMKSQKFCPHFHLSLQSLCDKTLKGMNRSYNAKQCLELIENISENFDNPFIGCDIIVGFPGESKEDFECSITNIRESNLTRIHVFPYSKRPNTPASKMLDQINMQEKKKRVKIVRSISDSKYEQFLRKNLYTENEAIIEIKSNKRYGSYVKGVTKNYIEILVLENECKGELNKVFLDRIERDKIIAKII